MSSTNGIGRLQSIVNSIATGEIKSTQQTNSAQDRTSSGPTRSTTSPSPSDQASLSETGSVIAQALNTDDVRADKVAALQQAINSGTYNVSSSDVADKLIQSLIK